MLRRTGGNSLETKLNSSLIAKVTLIIVSAGKRVSKAGEQVIKLHWPNRDLRGDGNVEASADDEIEGIVSRGFVGRETPGIQTAVIEIAVKISVCSAEQYLTKWLEMLGPVFENWSDVVGKQIALSRIRASRLTWAECASGR
jgi:hypothetical protein